MLLIYLVVSYWVFIIYIFLVFVGNKVILRSFIVLLYEEIKISLKYIVGYSRKFIIVRCGKFFSMFKMLFDDSFVILLVVISCLLSY